MDSMIKVRFEFWIPMDPITPDGGASTPQNNMGSYFDIRHRAHCRGEVHCLISALSV